MLLIAQFLICLGTALQGQCVGEGPSIIWGNPPTTNHPQKLSLSSCKLGLENTHIPLSASYFASYFPNMKQEEIVLERSARLMFADLGKPAQMLQISEKSWPDLLRVGVEVTLFQPPIVVCAWVCMQRRRFHSCSSTIWTYNVRNRTIFIIFTNRLVFRSGFNS